MFEEKNPNITKTINLRKGYIFQCHETREFAIDSKDNPVEVIRKSYYFMHKLIFKTARLIYS